MTKDDDSRPGSSEGASPGLRRPEPLGHDAARPSSDAPISLNLRKEQVRAALFRKLEPVRVGRFILLEPLGSGAMGEIYAAYDDRLDRKVALKLVRSGTVMKADERLLREAQTLAQVSHPNVVQIYEAGTYNGRLFIAMELIRGKTLSSWLREAAQLPRAVRQREILRQFIAAGRGLEAAHAAGVAHRDFKPDNVLVGDDGRVRVVDFGLARALVDDLGPGSSAATARAGDDASSAAKSREAIGSGPTVMLQSDPPADDPDAAIPLVTGGSTIDHEQPPHAPVARPGKSDPPAKPGRSSRRDDRSSRPKLKAAVRLTETGTVMGTPCFMAPEQMRGAVADLRSDQFSFCVALYYALYDTFPFAGRSLRELRDSMDTDEVEFASGVPVPTFVRKALYRGLSVDPAHRFDSMTELLAAIEPRSRRRGWIAAAVAVCALAVGTAGYLESQVEDPCAAADAGIDAAWSADRQIAMHAAFMRSNLPFAAPAWRGVKERLDGYAKRWRDSATAACQATHVAHTQSAQQLDKRMLCLDRGRRELAALVGELGKSAPDAVEHAIEAAGSLPNLSACSRAENLLFGLVPPPLASAVEVAAIRGRLARASTLELLGRYDESLVIAREASATTARLDYAPVRAEALVQVARALGNRSTTDTRIEAQKLYFEALTIAEAERHDQLALEIWSKLVMLAMRMDSGMTQAHVWWDQAHAWWRRNAAGGDGAAEDSYEEAKLYHVLGEIYYREGEYVKAAAEERRAIAAIARAPAHQLELSRYYGALAKALEYLDALDEAKQLHERALAIARETLGGGHPNVIKLEINYGKVLEKAGERGSARSILEHALANIPLRQRESNLDAALINSFLSDLDYRDGQLDSAAFHGLASLHIYQHMKLTNQVRLAESYTNLANVEFKRRNFRSALSLYENALALRRSHLSDGHYQIAVNEGSIAETLVELERYDEALTHLSEAERSFQQSPGRERGTQAWILTVRGEVLVGRRQFDVAIPVLEQARRLFGDDAADPSNQALAMWALARALYALGQDWNRIRALARGAHAIFVAQGKVETHNRDKVARFLAELGEHER